MTVVAIPVHRWLCQKYEGSWHCLACNAMDGPLEMVAGTKHRRHNLENQKTKQTHFPIIEDLQKYPPSLPMLTLDILDCPWLKWIHGIRINIFFEITNFNGNIIQN